MKVLKALGFNDKFSNLIFQCNSIVQYSFLLNGGICQSFNPSRGLRQGDLLSPYLFILGSEILMRLINREVNKKNISAIKVASSAPPISRLCYADDVIIFCKAKHSKLVSLKKCLEKYCSWSGQLISIEKSGVFPSKGVTIKFLRQVKCCWGLNSLPQSTTYLKVPLFLFKNMSYDVKMVKERLESKLGSWKGRNLSWTRRATLIKFVAQSIPTYTMAILQFPKKLCDQLDSVVRRF